MLGHQISQSSNSRVFLMPEWLTVRGYDSYEVVVAIRNHHKRCRGISWSISVHPYILYRHHLSFHEASKGEDHESSGGTDPQLIQWVVSVSSL